ncbi:MAG: hypothetical protein P1V20_23025 [Verrucomicrobiales bacterium]|nr:hypothetical protein [Verrucomicrobiales bacterium]
MLYLLRIFPAITLFALCGCIDTERLDRLEADIRAIKSDTRDAVETLRAEIDAANLKQDDGAGTPIESRFDHLEKKFSELLEKYDDRGDMAYLSRNNLNGHATMQTDHGSFLVRLEGIDLNVGGQGFNVHLSIGNTTGVSIQQFVLKGDFGSGVPVLSPGQDYSLYNKQIDEWQRTLTPFEVMVTKPLKPMSWTPIDVVLEASSRDDLDLMRFAMVVQNAHLEGISASGSSGDSYAHLEIDSNAAGVLKTDYGAFLVVARDPEAAGVGTRVKIDLGNPYGFTVNQCRLVGDFGQPIPKRGVGEPQAKFLARLDEWTSSLKPFSAQIDSKISSFRWNEASVLIPGAPGEVKFLRAQLRIENVTLPHATDR